MANPNVPGSSCNADGTPLSRGNKLVIVAGLAAALGGCADGAKPLDIMSMPEAQALKEQTKERIQTHLDAVKPTLTQNERDKITDDVASELGLSSDELEAAKKRHRITHTVLL